MNFKYCKDCKHNISYSLIDISYNNVDTILEKPHIKIRFRCSLMDEFFKIDIKNKNLKRKLNKFFKIYPIIRFSDDNKFYGYFDYVEKFPVDVDEKIKELIFNFINDLEVSESCPYYVEQEMERINNE